MIQHISKTWKTRAVHCDYGEGIVTRIERHTVTISYTGPAPITEAGCTALIDGQPAKVSAAKALLADAKALGHREVVSETREVLKGGAA